MINKFITKIFGSRNERQVKRFAKIVEQINLLEPNYTQLSDADLQAKTVEFRRRLDDGTTLEALIPEAFAAVREAGKRALNMRHFDVQLIGGMVLHEGKISEMRTGEGKTLVATLPAYLNALTGKGVHVVTVNDYLARRDAEWMGKLYRFLGMTTGVIVHDMEPLAKRDAYACDITYATNNEIGFDYLRDNMVLHLEQRVQRGLHYAIIDEVDSILIDEARTPLIISGATDDNSDLYKRINNMPSRLEAQEREPHKDDLEEVPGDYYVDEKSKQITLSDSGHQKVEDFLIAEGILNEQEGLYDAANISLMHHVNAALRAHILFHKDVEYIIQDGQIVIVDEFTGRAMPGRRWSEGLHQAIEAKEGVKIQNENQTLASITFQNLFRIYDKLAGMTGTADTEAYEFQTIYKLEVTVVPTHRPMVRDDKSDLVYLSAKEKYLAIVEDIKDCVVRGQPVLVGTTSIETSELLSSYLNQDGIGHQVLNAKFHQQEAGIIAQAGRPGSVTIATNMAGRGTDIVLGGNLEAEIIGLGNNPEPAKVDELRDTWKNRHELVLKSGGLHIIGTERHESRRIDNQLRGRSGRQGDPGSTRFYLSLQDNLMRRFASDRVAGLMQRFGMEEGEAIEHPWVTKAIENAQRKVEGFNFDIRKQLLEYDDVANDQRKVIYEQRNELLENDSVKPTLDAIRHDMLQELIDEYIPPQSMDELWNVPELEKALESQFVLKLPLQKWLAEDDDLHEESLRRKIAEALDSAYQEKEQRYGEATLRHFENVLMLSILDRHWKEHLAAMDYLRQGIHLYAYAQKNPKQEYKRQAFEMFQHMLVRFKQEVAETLTKAEFQLPTEQEIAAIQADQAQTMQAMQFRHAQVQGLNNELANKQNPQNPQNPPQPNAAPPPSRGKRAAPNQAQAAQAQAEAHTPFVRVVPKVGRNEPCPCGSGKKYKHCHGKLPS